MPVEMMPNAPNAAANRSNWTVANRTKSMLARPRSTAPWTVLEVVVMVLRWLGVGG